MKKILSLILFLSVSFPFWSADSNWKIHPIFDEVVTHVVETPNYVYFTSRQFPENEKNEVLLSLFRYDKKGEEIIPLSRSNILNGNSVRDVIYNPSKGYLAVIYKNYNIDLIQNDGKVINIPSYAQSSLTYSKNINSMAVDAANDRLYLATDFGYVAINDKKHEVAESRIYGEPLQAFCRVGDTYLAIKGNELLKASAGDPRLSLDQYATVANLTAPKALYPLSSNVCLLVSGDNSHGYIKKMTLTGGGVEITDLIDGNFHNIENTNNGVVVTSGDEIFQITSDGTYTILTRPSTYKDCAATTTNMSDVWNGMRHKGLSKVKRNGENWSLTHDWMLPNAPATYVSTSFANHPTEGMLILSHGINPPTRELYNYAPFQLSSYKQGRWKNHSYVYTNPSKGLMLEATNGVVVDPDNPNYVYITSYHNGFLRLNLNNPNDIIHFVREGDRNLVNSDFVVIDPVEQTSKGYWNIGNPYFDSKGNLWMYFCNNNDLEDPNPFFYCWLAEDRKATTSIENVRPPKIVEFDVFFPQTNLSLALPLVKSGKGYIVFTCLDGGTHLGLLDFNGTPTDTSDDRTFKFPQLNDSDGNTLDLGRVRYLWEDPSTGYVWVCHGNGVCYFIPSQVVNGNYQLNRVKVPRNDGTNLADYLLDGVSVNGITSDSQGRKWFATAGGGLVCTSADGREILDEFTIANSLLPDDEIYGVGFNSDANSLMVSTAQGYVEYLLPAASTSSTKTDIKAYPNPVRPDYAGYVTITDIPSGSFVKIADSAGNLVKDLGIMSGFEILWDLSDSNFNRVKGGVYHILVSPSDETSSYSTVGKILVIS